jgi:hypothetical protein
MEMRLWSLHPKYLDPQGLVAVWREALLAQAVLLGKTKGYTHHPQLNRFKNSSDPLSAISIYLQYVYAEAKTRGYDFDEKKVLPAKTTVQIPVTTGQISYEWQHLLKKLSHRSPEWHQKWLGIQTPEAHPIFVVQEGEIEPWERV